ncbi:outer membrane beta-barrel protein [Thalassospira sp.]|uniref:outer membrane beta-barrel protein n=1 Tax=Thalassospira sp. TaxID=1912094 RepID=UPI0025EEC0A8|nr:outer membrane beta-barrel protein [Thalassospira sp.]|tara:strand:+ start:3427 stop:4635 length:1209 start_codon:yes stop_codon:yes gene_type:complete
MRKHLLPISVALLCASPPATARAMENPDDVSGFRLGRLLLSPTLATGTRYDSNIFQSDTNPTSDVITTLAPRLTLQGDWRVFHLHLSARGELGFFADSSSDDYQDLELSVASSLDLGATSLEAGIEVKRAHDPRGSNDVPTSATEPVIYDDISTLVGARHVSDGLHYESQFSLRRLAFDDSTARNGSRIRNDDRDRLEMRETLRVLLPLDPKREAYGEVSFNQRQYDRIPDDDGRIRDSSGYQLLGGIRLDLTDLITADLAAGWMNQSYADPAFGNIADYTLRGDFDWSITRLTNITFNAARTVHETTQTGASGILAFEVGSGISHELRRGLTVSLNAAYSSENYQQTTRRDRTHRLGFGLRYALNRFAEIEGGLAYDQRTSNSAGEDYDRLQSNIRLKLEM